MRIDVMRNSDGSLGTAADQEHAQDDNKYACDLDRTDLFFEEQ